LRLGSGATLLLECSWAQWVPEDLCYVTVYGAEGGAGIEWVPGTPKRSLTVWSERLGKPEVLRPSLPPDGEHAESVADFLSQVRSPGGSRRHGEAALLLAEIVDACYASAAAGREIELISIQNS
jgi:predicted dehydrogenase